MNKDEPKFWVGDKLRWPDGPAGNRDVTVRYGPMRIEVMREAGMGWGDQPVYLCDLPDKTALLIGEAHLHSYWVICPGEHRRGREDDWEKLQWPPPTGKS